MIEWPIQEEELATRSYREVADNEMDLWIKVIKQLFALSFGQLKLSFVIFIDSFSDVPESRVWFASKILTPCRMH